MRYTSTLPEKQPRHPQICQKKIDGRCFLFCALSVLIRSGAKIIPNVLQQLLKYLVGCEIDEHEINDLTTKYFCDHARYQLMSSVLVNLKRLFGRLKKTRGKKCWRHFGWKLKGYI